MNQRPAIISLLPLVLALCGCAQEVYDNPPSVAKVNAIRKELDSTSTGAGDTAAVVAADPTGWATIKGKFTILGKPPTMQALNTSHKDMCGASFDQSVEVDPGTSGIRDVLMFLDDGLAKNDVDEEAPKWVNERYSIIKHPELATVEFDQKDCRFLSHVFACRSDQEVKILNSDPFDHNTKLDANGSALVANSTVPGNSSITYAPGGASNGAFPVSCSIHPWMSASILVAENPYFAVSEKTGEFEIKDLPAGVPLEFRVWQAKANYVQDVTVNGQSEKWSKGKFEVTLQPGEVKEMNIVIDASVFN